MSACAAPPFAQGAAHPFGHVRHATPGMPMHTPYALSSAAPGSMPAVMGGHKTAMPPAHAMAMPPRVGGTLMPAPGSARNGSLQMKPTGFNPQRAVGSPVVSQGGTAGQHIGNLTGTVNGAGSLGGTTSSTAISLNGTGSTSTLPKAIGSKPVRMADTCNMCGAAFLPEALYCRKCGAKRPEAPAVTSGIPSAPSVTSLPSATSVPASPSGIGRVGTSPQVQTRSNPTALNSSSPMQVPSASSPMQVSHAQNPVLPSNSSSHGSSRVASSVAQQPSAQPPAQTAQQSSAQPPAPGIVSRNLDSSTAAPGVVSRSVDAATANFPTTPARNSSTSRSVAQAPFSRATKRSKSDSPTRGNPGDATQRGGGQTTLDAIATLQTNEKASANVTIPDTRSRLQVLATPRPRQTVANLEMKFREQDEITGAFLTNAANTFFATSLRCNHQDLNAKGRKHLKAPPASHQENVVFGAIEDADSQEHV